MNPTPRAARLALTFAIALLASALFVSLRPQAGLVAGLPVNETELRSNPGPASGDQSAFLPIVYSCEILYFDNFSNPNSGWPVVDTGDTLYEYRNGEYRTLVREPFGIAGAIPGVPFDNYLLSADVRNFADKAGTYGLLFGQVSGWTGLYTFEVDNAKHYEIWRWSGSWALLDSGTSPALKPGTASNRLSVERQGDRIRAYANGAFVTEITDSFFTGLKRVGVWATGLGQANLDVRFDNYTVEPIGCGLSAGDLPGAGLLPGFNAPSMTNPGWLTFDLPPRSENP